MRLRASICHGTHKNSWFRDRFALRIGGEGQQCKLISSPNRVWAAVNLHNKN
ncbi:protein of unknown function [Vibrio tapetis subsp. tapetis]|uniref:Uncharacterized protein n=1 Tax=Vibrio tapetis subsp. tapetis TaxID=1671868 RepID=A0A2N8Z8C2_9VIBR|nr:protein of unknown function [Vibrio tapetis subsp. tapetis]